ncbi:hypothetical protein BDV30DRAFT_236189 [Aspergillus minisclerotigenes]|uniref:Uncharacterized protein n=1 Tax=Aspergillus minisclerotigenes TaxID=656917 RepID=A0A5N6JDS0_9EURO|nr:hypothetical protein BDV30DRAFT_236189 [Aspergillus minisclerotigenes]
MKEATTAALAVTKVVPLAVLEVSMEALEVLVASTEVVPVVLVAMVVLVVSMGAAPVVTAALAALAVTKQKTLVVLATAVGGNLKRIKLPRKHTLHGWNWDWNSTSLSVYNCD